MIEIINDVTKIITEGEQELTEPCVPRLTDCAIRISRLAFLALRGELREKALNIAKAIADYEDELAKESRA